jgi:hypothetical protein
MHDEIAAAHGEAPEREDAFISRLRIHRVGGTGVRRAVRHLVAPRQLAAHHAGDFMYSGVPKAGAPDFMSTLEVKPP